MVSTVTFAYASAQLTSLLGGTKASQLAAEALLEAELLNQPRFGLDMLGEATADTLSASFDTLSQRNTDSAVLWHDSCATYSPIAIADAVLHLADLTRAHGVAAIFLRGVRGFGRFAPFLRFMADQGLVAFAGAQGPVFVAPDGGTKPAIGTNPFAFAAGQGEQRIIIDVASSLATMAAIKTARADGQPLPENIALDARGQMTTIAADVTALLPRGGHFGSLVGLLVEMLAGVIGQGRGDASGRGVFLIGIDPQAGGDETLWQDKLVQLRSDWRNSGGHWPGQFQPKPSTALTGDVLTRFETAIAHLTKLKEQSS